ncbi:MAG: elongation factor P [Chitinophagales bacterium]|jgi:elongation factor P|nr:elongation factor P [Chitinophagales bacterium]
MASTSDIRKGLCFRNNGEIWTVVEFLHVKPGKGPAFVRTKMKNLKNGKVIEQNIPAGHTIDDVRVERRKYQFLYNDETGYHFMNNENYEQITIQGFMISYPELLKEGQDIEMLISAETEEPLTVDLPSSITLRVTYTEPAVAGNTATNATKSATLETGAKIQVPLFINEEDLIKINTEQFSYVERVKE